MAGKISLRIGYAGVVLLSMAAIAIGYLLADSYIDRLPDHRGFYLVEVDNAVTTSPLQKPRRTILVVVDGLREDQAREMSSAKRLAELGQCRTTWAGPLTISRPVYTVISTGLEQDRSGSRNNDDTSPVAVQSIWEVAREAGLQVHAASNLEWWEQLFPGAFSSYRFDLDETQNLFVVTELADLSLIHPLRVDTAGHKYGAASKEYREAVAIVDRELSAFIDQLDLRQDLLILTADHGHSESGGHGGSEPGVSQVLTCYAGPTIVQADPHWDSPALSDLRLIAPTIAVLLGLPFPKHMRASDDKLDQIWSLVRTDLLGAEYVQERKKTIEFFRQQNAAKVGELLGQESGTWNQWYAQGTRRHRIWWVAVALFLTIAFLVASRLRGQSRAQGLAGLLWMMGAVALSCTLYTWLRGSFDFTSINKREEFLNVSMSVSFGVGLLSSSGHLLLWRDIERLTLDHTCLLVGLLVVSLAHPLIYGLTLGSPLPGPVALFLPFILGALVISAGALNLVFGGVCLAKALSAGR